MSEDFKTICREVMPILMDGFEWLDFQAAGCLGNLAHECNGFTQLREIAYLHGPANRGGYGWAQWTGPRRVSFLEYCDTHKLDWHSKEANLGYLLDELRSKQYARTVAAVAKAKDINAATIAFERGYEAAGVVAMGSRKRWARKTLIAYQTGLHPAVPVA